MKIREKKTKTDDTGKVFTAFRLRGDVVKYLNSVADFTGESTAKIVEEALWKYLPEFRAKVLQRRREAQELAHWQQTKKKGTK